MRSACVVLCVGRPTGRRSCRLDGRPDRRVPAARRRTPATLRHLPLSPTSAIPDLYPVTVAVTLTVNLGLNFNHNPNCKR